MNFRSILFASLLSLLAFNIESVSMLTAAENNPKEPGPTDKDAPKQFTTTKSGLKYKILRKSDGVKPAEDDEVEVHYKGWLDGGKVFDSSYGPDGESVEFPLDRVVKGWTEGLQLIGKGGMIELEIPYQLGYGAKGQPPQIPPKATLHFTVELLNVFSKGAGTPDLIDKDAPKEFTQTASGLKYRILRASDGKKPKPTDKVRVHYKGWFDNGEEFDSSYKRERSISFPLNQVIKGWTEGMQLVGTGGMIELEVPYELAYGAAGRPGIPPKSNLHFLVELLNVK